jgi:hypothetical protein
MGELPDSAQEIAMIFALSLAVSRCVSDFCPEIVTSCLRSRPECTGSCYEYKTLAGPVRDHQKN